MVIAILANNGMVQKGFVEVGRTRVCLGFFWFVLICLDLSLDPTTLLVTTALFVTAI